MKLEHLLDDSCDANAGRVAGGMGIAESTHILGHENLGEEGGIMGGDLDGLFKPDETTHMKRAPPKFNIVLAFGPELGRSSDAEDEVGKGKGIRRSRIRSRSRSRR